MSNAPSTKYVEGAIPVKGQIFTSDIAPNLIVDREATTGALVVCPNSTRKGLGSTQDKQLASSAGNYWKHGRQRILTDGTGVMGDYMVAKSDGSGKGVKESSSTPSASTFGVYCTTPDADNYALVEQV